MYLSKRSSIECAPLSQMLIICKIFSILSVKELVIIFYQKLLEI